MVEEAQRRGTDGVICGHIHTAEMREIDGITHCNDGDWVESCTALVEHEDGRLEILRWADMQGLTPLGKDTCESSSSATPGFLKSMASSVRSIL